MRCSVLHNCVSLSLFTGTRIVSRFALWNMRQKRLYTVCVLNASSSLGTRICRMLMKKGHSVRAVVNHIDNARELDGLLTLQEQNFSQVRESMNEKSDSSFEIFEVNPLHHMSFAVPFKNCDCVVISSLHDEFTKVLTRYEDDKYKNMFMDIMHNVLHCAKCMPSLQAIILCLVKINLESAVKANSDSNALLSHPFEDNRHVSDLNISAVVVSDMAGSCCVCDHSISRKDPQNMKKVISWVESLLMNFPVNDGSSLPTDCEEEAAVFCADRVDHISAKWQEKMRFALESRRAL